MNSQTFKIIKNQSGSAILFSVFLMSLLLYIALEISKDTIVEYHGSLNSVRRVQAYYAAKSCQELSLLRVKAYQQATRSLGKAIPNPSMLDMIWQFPLMWPIVAPPDLSEGDRSMIAEAMKASTFKHQFSSKIVSQSGKIDINDLASSSEVIRTKTQEQVLNIFQRKLAEPNSEWARKYANYRFEDLIKHMADWIDPDRSSLVSGDESTYYRDLGGNPQYMPPNQPFKTYEELHMIPGMEDDIYDVLVPEITLYGGKGINVNYAEKEMLMALDPQITKEIVDEILKRRQDINLGGPFKNEKDFFGFLNGYGINTSDFNEKKVPLYYDNEINFYISCIGVVGKVSREITSVVYDFQKVQWRLTESMAESQVEGECRDLKGDQLYECLCKDVQDGAKKKECIANRKKADEDIKQDQGADAPLPAGPPYVIFRDVK